MGGSVSSGQDNDELVDNLIKSGFIRSKTVEQVFRAVDRADYMLSSHRENAYKDFAWKHGNIHLSSPCVYCEVMEGLSLEPGLSFLNFGSGTGYLSTMAGLILTQSGVNHGIELHEDCVKYSYDRLEEFKQNSCALDEFDFCEPSFVQGNCLNIVPSRRYDRVYCGATCSDNYEDYIRQFVKVGGILVMPIRDHLFRYERIDMDNWKLQSILPVTFASLVIPTAIEQILIYLPECKPLSLQELCRGMIRRRLRQNIWSEHDDLESEKLMSPEGPRPSTKLGTLYPVPLSLYEESDDSITDAEEDENGGHIMLNFGHANGAMRTTIRFLRIMSQGREMANMVAENVRSEDESFDSDSVNEERASNYTMGDQLGTEAETETAPTTTSATYSNIIESDSEHDLELVQRKKVAKREKTFSESEQSSNVQENREDACSTIANASDSDDMECNSTENNSQHSPPPPVPPPLPLKQNIKPDINIMQKRQDDENESEDEESANTKVGHYIDTEAFSSYMRDKIWQLPLPYSLKVYINYDRNF